jgi:hypothetical protein
LIDAVTQRIPNREPVGNASSLPAVLPHCYERLAPDSPAPDTSDYLQQLQVLRAWVWLVQLLTLLLGRQWLSAAQFYALLGLLSVALLMLLLGHYRLQWFRRQSRAPDEREFLFQLLLPIVWC